MSASGSRRFVRDLAWSALSQAWTTLLVGIVTLPALTKSYTTEVFGVWAQASTTVNLLAPIMLLQFGITLIRFLAGEESHARRREAFAAMLWPIVCFSGMAILVSLAMRGLLSSLMFSKPQYGSLAALTVLWAAQEAVFTYLMCYQQACQRMRRLAVFRMTLAVARAASIFSLAEAGYDLEWVVACIICLGFMWSAVAFALAVRDMGLPLPTLKRLREYLGFSLPAMPNGIMSWSIVGGCRYFLAHFTSLSDVGVFAASWSLANLVLLLSVPVAMVLYPALIGAWEQGQLTRVRGYFSYSNKLFLGLGIPVAMGLTVLSQQLLRLLATHEYAAGRSVVFLMSLATVCIGVQQINIHVVYLVKQTKWMPLLTGGIAATNATLCLCLVPAIGLKGAAVALLVSYFLPALILTMWVGRTVGAPLDLWFLSKVVLGSLAMAVCVRYSVFEGVFGIISAVIVGITVYGVAVLLLRVLSEQDKALVRDLLRRRRTGSTAGQ